MLKEYFAVLRKAVAVKPLGEEVKLLPPDSIFIGDKRDVNLPRLLKLNAIRKLSELEVSKFLSKNAEDDDIIVVLD